jgi:hypothetical protein
MSRADRERERHCIKRQYWIGERRRPAVDRHAAKDRRPDLR